MKRINTILLTTVFFLSGLNAQEQIAWNFNRNTQNQPVFKGTTFTTFEGNNFVNGTSSLKDTSITNDKFYGGCPAAIMNGGLVCNFFAFALINDIIPGIPACGPWGAWGAWSECLVLVSRKRSRACAGIGMVQTWHKCTYLCAGWQVKFVSIQHKHGPPVPAPPIMWVEDEFDYGMGSLFHWLSTTPELNDAIKTVSSDNEFVVNYTGKKATMVVGSPFKITEDQNLPPQIEGIKYNIDGLDMGTGQSVLMNSVGEHLIIAEINVKSGGVVKFNIPFYVIKPVTVEEITQKALSNGEIQFDIKIQNNNKVHPSVAWVSTSMLNKPEYDVEIQGPRQYNLTEGSSALINVLLRPAKNLPTNAARPEAPVSFDFIVSSPTPNGLIIDRKTVTARPDAITTPGGTAGIDGPQKVRTISVKTLSGEVIDVKVPNIIRPGDQITGGVVTKSQSATLEGAVVDVEKKESNLKDKLFKFIVPAGVASIPFLLKDKNGATIGSGEMPVNRPNIPTPGPGMNLSLPPNQIEMLPFHAPGSFAPINYCQPGEPLTINGFFDGNASNTNVTINNIPCEIITESNTGSFAQIPDNLSAGKASLTIEEGGVTQTMPIQVITTSLTTNKSTLRKGAKAEIKATVSGLDGLKLADNHFTIQLTNQSPANITLKSETGNTITRNITESDVKGGVYSFTTTVTGIATGPFTLNSNVSSTTCTSCWEKYKNCIANCEAQEKKCYDACDKGNQGIGCYLACSAAARLCEAACWAEYLNCVRQKFGY
jgi:hypothetical protein